MIRGAPNFCPKNDLMHCVSLSKLRRFFLPKLRCSQKVFTETETVFCRWCAQIIRLFARIFDVLNQMGGRPPPPPRLLRLCCDLQVFSDISNCNYRSFVKEIMLEISFIEIDFISSNWSATSHIIRSILVQKK